ncbi:Clavaminate synthase-like protein [Gloeophyllum trabeum ATCC 11539]|uniref:Clavaminate synthase-like protein n=1 Tax=Gloeophyllum trabeum (strain ATCC 11539 / FP-39264 / Madison 617) TaxID=670483 RepID=S7RNZ3_GLOTA|nr:Clavaminate synthase-like protein [Gloeophyllum trabeum ATCC 11539]EPQ54484.1 Clavaminate synthase-like protein [Gloeophyllum trabeum ATCC 11539]
MWTVPRPPNDDSYRLSSLPIVSLDPYIHPEGHNGKGRLSTAAALHAACVEYGFFYLDVSTFIHPDEPNELMRLARDFFALPQEEKDNIGLAKEDGARGYQRIGENVTNGKADNHEAIDFYRPVGNPDKSRPLWGNNQWPDIPGFREKYEKWVEKMKELGLIVMEAMATGLGMSPEEWKDLKSKVDDSFWVLRVIGYPPLQSDDDSLSCGSHKDYGCLTFLYQDDTKDALQVYLSRPGTVVRTNIGLPAEEIVEEGGVWISADPVPGCLLVNVGEMWERWTNGLYTSTLHRVIHRGSNYRVSIPFFFEPNFDARVEPLPAAIRMQEGIACSNPYLHGAKHRDVGADGMVPVRYEPVVYGQFLLAKVQNNFAKYE